jgi:hypothetical protein
MKAMRALRAAFDPRAGGGREASRRPRRDGTHAGHWWFRGALLSLLLLALLSAELPELHAHDGDTPGFYNEECPLGRLAVRTYGLAASAMDTARRPDPAPDAATSLAAAAPSTAPRAPFAARAPPATS